MLFKASPFLLVLLASTAAAVLHTNLRANEAFQSASPDVESEHYLQLKTGGASRSASLLASLRKDAADAETAGSAGLTSFMDLEYLVDIEFKNTNFTVIVDTGSSDTWLVRKGFSCVNEDLRSYSESDCGFGPTFNGSFSGGAIKNENFNITYADGEFVIGVLGYERVTVAGISVIHQEVALINEAYFEGDGLSSGLMGLAYKTLTSAFKGTDASVDNPTTNAVPYSPIFQSMYTQGLVAPIFSLALERYNDTVDSAPGGYIAFGGYPPVNFTANFSSTPIRILELVDLPSTATNYSFYTIYIDGWTGSSNAATTSSSSSSSDTSNYGYSNDGGNGGPPNGGGGPPNKLKNRAESSDDVYIVDSGTSLIYVPDMLYEEIAALFSPQAGYVESEGAAFAYCDAVAPTLGVSINGTIFYINAQDLILQDQYVETREGRICVIGVQPGGDGPYILGDAFLQNVVAVFDVGAGEMRFAAHSY